MPDQDYKLCPQFPPCPDDRDVDCRFQRGLTLSTSERVYRTVDRAGNCHVDDPNTHSTRWTCTVCHREFWERRCEGKVTWSSDRPNDGYTQAAMSMMP